MSPGLITFQIDAGPVPPCPAGRVECAGEAGGPGGAGPGASLLPSRVAVVEDAVEPVKGLLGRLVGTEPGVRLEELLTGWAQAGVLGGEPFDPARAVEVGDEVGIAAPVPAGEVEQHGGVAGGEQRVVAEQAGCGAQVGGDYDRGRPPASAKRSKASAPPQAPSRLASPVTTRRAHGQEATEWLQPPAETPQSGIVHQERGRTHNGRMGRRGNPCARS